MTGLLNNLTTICVLTPHSIRSIGMMRFIIYAYLMTVHIYCFGQDSGRSMDSVFNQLRQVRLVEDTIQNYRIGGHFVTAIVIEGDTLIIARIDNINISSPRSFASQEEYLKYMRYKHYAAHVYPYAKEAIRIFREAEQVTKSMRKRHRKKYLNKLSAELEREFEDPLKSLTKTQGKILVKMIEKELGMSMFDLIKMTQGGAKAFYWNQSSKLYGYRLKNEYTVGENRLLDIVLDDLDLSYDTGIDRKN